jgi:predicted RNase H-like nuclease (RuvC/YqgF family)
MQKMGQQQHSQLEACTTGLQAKLEELRDLNVRMEGLCSSAKELLENFGSEDARFRAEFKTQLESLERFRDERISIEALRERLRAEQEKVEDYERRIERVQLRVERQKEKESVKKRVSCKFHRGTQCIGHRNNLTGLGSGRVRFLWGFMAMLVILWLLATAGSDGDDMSGNAALGEPIKLAPPSSRSECDLEEFSLE